MFLKTVSVKIRLIVVWQTVPSSRTSAAESPFTKLGF
jgi:hypothetical protein